MLKYTCTCFLQKGCEAYKANHTGVVYWVFSHHNEDDLFLLEVVYKLAKELLANHDLISFFDIDVTLRSAFIALRPVQRRLLQPH